MNLSINLIAVPLFLTLTIATFSGCSPRPQAPFSHNVDDDRHTVQIKDPAPKLQPTPELSHERSEVDGVKNIITVPGDPSPSTSAKALALSANKNLVAVFDGEQELRILNLGAGNSKLQLTIPREAKSAGTLKAAFATDQILLTCWPSYPGATWSNGDYPTDPLSDDHHLTAAQKLLQDWAKKTIVRDFQNPTRSGLTQWSLNTGEAIKRIDCAGNRVILSFGVTNKFPKLVFTLESQTNADKTEYWICSYDLERCGLVSESELTDLQQLQGQQVAELNICEKTGKIVVCTNISMVTIDYANHRFVTSDRFVLSGFAGSYTRPRTDDGWHTIHATIIGPEALFNVVSGYEQTMAVRRHSLTDLTVDATRDLTSYGFSSTPESIFYSDVTNQLGVCWKVSEREYKTILFDDSLSSEQLVTTDEPVSAFAGRALLVPTGVRAFAANPNRSLGRSPREELLAPQQSQQKTIPVDYFLAGTYDSVLFSNETGLVVNKSPKNQNLAEFSATTIPWETVLQNRVNSSQIVQRNIQAVYSPTRRGFLVAIPTSNRKRPLLQELEDSLRIGSESYDHNSPPSGESLKSAFCFDWHLACVTIPDLQVEYIRTIRNSPCVRLTSGGATDALLVVDGLDEQILLTFSSSPGKDRILKLRVSDQTHARFLNNLQFVYQMLDTSLATDVPRSLDEADWDVLQSWMSPQRSLIFKSTGTDFLLCTSDPNMVDNGYIMVKRFSSTGTLLEEKRIGKGKSMGLQILEQLAQETENPPMLSTMFSSPFAIDYNSQTNALYYFSLSNDETHETVPNGALTPSSEMELVVDSVAENKTTRIQRIERPFAREEFCGISELCIDDTGQFLSCSILGRTCTSLVYDIYSRRYMHIANNSHDAAFFNDKAYVQSRQNRIQMITLSPESSLPPRAANSEVYFVGIGANEFLNPAFPELVHSAKDVKIVSNKLETACNRTGKRFVPYLSVDSSARPRDIGNSLDEIARVSTESDFVIIYISSHGYIGQRGLYIAMSGSSPESLQSTAIGWVELTRALQRIRANRILLLLDTCQAASFADSHLEIVKQVQADLANKERLTIVATGGSNPYSVESDLEDQSRLASAFLQTINDLESRRMGLEHLRAGLDLTQSTSPTSFHFVIDND